MPGVTVDAEGGVRSWLNADTALCGTGGVISNGFHLEVRQAPSQGTVGILTRNGGGPHPQAQPFDQARLQAEIYGPNRESAARAARMYIRKLENVAAAPGSAPALVDGETIRVVTVSEIQGPLWQPDNGYPRYIVQATFELANG